MIMIYNDDDGGNSDYFGDNNHHHHCYDDDDNDNDVFTPHQTDLAAEGVAVQGPELGDSLHPGLSHLSLHWNGSGLLEQHRVPNN